MVASSALGIVLEVAQAWELHFHRNKSGGIPEYRLRHTVVGMLERLELLVEAHSTSESKRGHMKWHIPGDILGVIEVLVALALLVV